MGRVAGRADGIELRARIVDAAGRLFAREGYEQASMRRIARSVGLTAPGLYYHFAGKRDLLFSCLESVLEDLVACGERALASAGTEPRRRLAAFTAAHVVFQIERMELQLIYDTALYGMGHLSRALSRKQQARLVELQRRHLDNLRNVLREGAARRQFRFRDVSTLAFAIIAIGEHVPTWFKPGGRLDRDALAEAYAELALRMAGARAHKGR